MLTEAQVKNARARDKRYYLRDDHGLYLDVAPSGTKAWRYRYWIDGKEHKISFGQYPLISLKDARERRDRARLQLLDGEKPGVKKETQKAVTFGEVFDEWMEKKVLPARAESYITALRSRTNNHLLPYFAKKPIGEITSLDILEVLRMIEARGHTDLSHRINQICSQVFRYGIATGRCTGDPSGGLRGALQTHVVEHQASIIDPQMIGQLLRDIAQYHGPIVREAMLFQAYTFVRPGELRHAEWAEVDLKEGLWKIPKEKMKMRRAHLVPLSSQALAILERIKPKTGHGKYIFPSRNEMSGEVPMSENAVTAALRRMGYKSGEMTGHGFRSMASTLLNENGFHPDWIERQLAHVEGNSVRAAYNYAEHMPERRKMMQWYADYLDKLREGK